MFRYTLKKGSTESKTGFRYRGTEPSRLETLTDTVFGFSITLLVVSLEVPKSYLELQTSMYSFLGFIFCTLMILAFWNRHYVLFLKYGIEDNFTKMLNFLLLFLLIFYVYPLKYLFNYLGTILWVKVKLAFGDHSKALQMKMQELQIAELNTDQWYDLMINFGIGLTAIQLIFFLWHLNAYRKRDLLDFNVRELAEIKADLWSFTFFIGVPILSILVVLIFGGYYSHYAGMVYLLIPVSGILYKKYVRKPLLRLT